MAENSLCAVLRAALGDTLVFYFQAHSAHWNVEGPEFVSLHSFFGDLAEGTYGAVDVLAEALRQHGDKAPTSFQEALKSAALPDKGPGAPTEPKGLIRHLGALNEKLMGSYKSLEKAATSAGDLGLSNKTQDFLAFHLKMDWQMKALLGITTKKS